MTRSERMPPERERLARLLAAEARLASNYLDAVARSDDREVTRAHIERARTCLQAALTGLEALERLG